MGAGVAFSSLVSKHSTLNTSHPPRRLCRVDQPWHISPEVAFPKRRQLLALTKFEACGSAEPRRERPIVILVNLGIGRKVTNWTRSSHIARIKIAVGVAYGSDVQLVLRLLKEAAETDRRVLRDLAPTPLFLRFGESALEFELHAWIADVKDLLSVRSLLCEEIAARFQEAHSKPWEVAPPMRIGAERVYLTLRNLALTSGAMMEYIIS